jgi:3-oxoacyl-[acyl-carrier-protein] synthase III
MEVPNPKLPTSVDITQIEQAVGWLEQVQTFVETYCIGAMPDIHKELGAASNIDMSDVDYKLHHDATVFGGFYSAYGLQARHDGVYKGVHDGLVEIAKHLGKTANATRTIAENYKTTEERNHAAAAEINRLLEGGRYTPKNPDAIAGKDTDPTKYGS